MTRERPFPQGPPGPTRPGGSGDACPDPAMLSAYLDGKLDATERARIEDHVSRCEDCYFVVRETALALADANDQGAARGGGQEPPVSPTPGVRLGRTPALLRNRYLLPLAATLVVAAGALTLWRQAPRAEAYSEAVRPLVEAVGEQRFFEPRLTGGFKFGPVVASKRSAGPGARSDAWAMLAVAGELRERTAPLSVANRATRAAAALFLGATDEAVAEFSNLVRDDPGAAEWQANLAAALLVRASVAQDTAERDQREALRYAEQAARLDPALAEAAFNRGLALKALGRAEEARRAFDELAARGDSWSPAAREQLRDIPGAAAPRP